MQEVIKVEALPVAQRQDGTSRWTTMRQAFSTRCGSLSWVKIALAGYFILFQMLDLLSTQIGLSLGMVEANGLAGQVIETAGRPGLALYKLAATALVLAVLIRLSVRFRRIWVAMYVANVLMTLVVGFNSLGLWLILTA